MRKVFLLISSFLLSTLFLFANPNSLYAQGTCTCEIGIPTGPGLCPWKLGVNNCNSGFLPICPELAVCTPTPPCICESVGSLDCGEENEFCCPGNTCFDPFECINLGGGTGDPGGGYRCLRPCDTANDCSPGEVCSGVSGGCTADPFNPPPPEVKIPVFCDSSGEPTTDNTGELYTAIGCIPFNTGNNFIRFILRWGIGIAGGIAFILIVIAAFQIITSQGDPKKLQAGRELLTSAIAGLVLLIFSVLILRIIGVNLLGIPGFGS